jgi:WhiB family transcriptional regulator, redox-sensing transcriptional regulator
MTTFPRPLSAEMITIPGRDWRLLAACRHADPELFIPVSASGPSLDQVKQAKAIWAGCPVRRQCLAFALDTRQDHGVWGGKSEEERCPRARKPCTRTRHPSLRR